MWAAEDAPAPAAGAPQREAKRAPYTSFGGDAIAATDGVLWRGACFLRMGGDGGDAISPLFLVFVCCPVRSGDWA